MRVKISKILVNGEMSYYHSLKSVTNIQNTKYTWMNSFESRPAATSTLLLRSTFSAEGIFESWNPRSSPTVGPEANSRCHLFARLTLISDESVMKKKINSHTFFLTMRTCSNSKAVPIFVQKLPGGLNISSSSSEKLHAKLPLLFDTEFTLTWIWLSITEGRDLSVFQPALTWK